jgi:hypothetical protein
MGRVLRVTSGLRAGALGVMLAASVACGQELATSSPASPQTVVDVLHQFSDKAEVIFAGQVMAIRHPNANVVEVEFRVDQAIRGCTTGTPYILREWAGLWEGDTPRYRVGQQLLMLLHAPSAAGMSSPVGGLDGAIPIRQRGIGNPVADGATPRQPPYVDLRWLGTRLPRAVSYSNGSGQSNVPGHAAKVGDLSAPFRSQLRSQLRDGSNVAVASGLRSGAAPITMMAGNGGSSSADSNNGGSSGPSQSSQSSVPAQQASVDAVMGMLTSWQKAQHGTP